MLDNLKVGKKLFLLSTSILLLMLAVMFSGYHGITRSVESSEDANEIQETAKLLATLEIDHLNWAEDVIEYLSNDQINSLDVQTDHTLCRFGKWYYGEERKRLEKILPEAKEKLQELEQPHKSLHSSVIQIQKAYRASAPDLGRMLMKSEAIHVDWAYEIQRSIATEENFLDVGVDPQQCELVQFLNGMGARLCCTSTVSWNSLSMSLPRCMRNCTSTIPGLKSCLPRGITLQPKLCLMSVLIRIWNASAP